MTVKNTVLREKGDCKEGRAHIGAKYLWQLYSSHICSKDLELHVQGFQGEGGRRVPLTEKWFVTQNRKTWTLKDIQRKNTKTEDWIDFLLFTTILSSNFSTLFLQKNPKVMYKRNSVILFYLLFSHWFIIH